MTDEQIREWALNLQKQLHTPWRHESSDIAALESAALTLIAEARREALEEAAKVCEAREYDHAEQQSGHQWEAHYCAAAIRSLAEEREGKS